MPPEPVGDRLRALARPDKWFLSDGEGILWAPPFPRWLDRPGFWDPAHIYEHPFAPLFTIALVRPSGTEQPLELIDRSWSPDRLRARWRAGDRILLEQRYALPGGWLCSAWRPDAGGTWANAGLDHCLLVAFTMQPGETTSRVEALRGTSAARWLRTLTDPRLGTLSVIATLAAIEGQGMDPPPRGQVAAIRSEGTTAYPSWDLTPFWDAWGPTSSGLANGIHLEGIAHTGFIHLAVAVSLEASRAEGLTFALQLTPQGLRRAPQAVTAERPVAGDPGESWERFFADFPVFRCSDAYFTRYYDYRLYGLRLNRVGGPRGNIRHPAIAEGIEYFHVPISYSAQCHMWETRWSRDPAMAYGSLLNFLEHQKGDGALHGRIYLSHLRHTNFYHANWGDAVLAVDALHPDRRFIARAYRGLARYARWLDTTRDAGGTGMYDVVNHYETGQEYMSRYQVAFAAADRRGWETGLLLKGIDVTVYVYQLKRALAALARRLDQDDDEREWAVGAERIGDAILGTMWDERHGWFSDVHPGSGERTGVKAAVCFYPLLTDLLTDRHVACLLAHLQEPTEFATPFPIPSSSADDPCFDPNARWKGRRHNCPWNGRVWPMTNSHVIEGLLRQWHGGRRAVGPVAARLLTRFVHMMFHDGDLDRPNGYEHYHPYTGRASVYRGIDDYQHSWVLDLLIRGAVGVEPRATDLLIDPLPMDLADLRFEARSLRGRRLAVERHGLQVQVVLGDDVYATHLGEPLEIAW